MSLKLQILQGILEKTPAGLKSKIINSDKWKSVFINLINPFVSKYGEVIDFRFYPEKKEIYLKMLLVGEGDTTELDIKDYDLIDNEENPSIVIKECTTSKEWITALAKDFLYGTAIPIPKDKFASIKNIL